MHFRTLAAFFLMITLSQPLRSQVKVEAIKFGTGIDKNEVIGEGTAFPAETEKVYCWFRVTGAKDRTILVKWYRNDVFVSETPLEITSNNMRTHSYKTIFGNGGEYKVEVIDDEGYIIQKAQFLVTGGTSVSTASSGTNGDLRVEAMKFGTGVEKTDVLGEATTFPASTDKVYCWLKVAGGNEKTITVRWHFNNIFMNDVPLEIKSNSMRTYAVKTIAGNKGEWKVDVLGPSGSVLQTATFIVE